VKQRAIVIGGSIAGLFAAAVLSQHFAEVVIFERDALRIADDAVPRRGVPQAGHSHVLLGSGARALETIFPGIVDELERDGASRGGDLGRDVVWYLEGGRFAPTTSGIEGFSMTRPFLESRVRARTRALPNVRFVDRTAVDAVASSRDARRITGVVASGVTHSAELVVDASGRGSRSTAWLTALGYARPATTVVDIDVRYTTRFFARPEHLPGETRAFIVPPTPESKRGGGMISQEGRRWIVTLISHFGEFPPSDLDGFIAFARDLPAGEIAATISQLEPLGDARTIRIATSVRRHYERLKSFPLGYLVIGDAISSFNPIYGPGMSVAALEAVALGEVLRTRSAPSSRRYLTRCAGIVECAWMLAAASDLRIPEARGRRRMRTRLASTYVPLLLRAAHSDPACGRGFLRVSNLLAAPRSLIRPAMLFRVARAACVRAASGVGRKRPGTA